MPIERDEPLYVISVAARMIGVHAQTLRYYERAGLIEPSRSRGNRRYYSELDLERLRRIKTLMDDMGMNLAGAEVVLRLTNRIQDLEQQVQHLVVQIERLRAEQERPALREGRPER
ncbi:MAG: MerR family transcriptional regulator [Chloroflexi bacterium]|nr:MerR family transcriptional regulator [Chloroflexota bacterium]MCZ6891127.1 MerR family transcriptional regulator [Chloroflexota bacterium]